MLEKQLRDYQQEAYDSIVDVFRYERRTLMILPTGTGKTVVFARLARDWPDGRVLVIAHREELIAQAARKIQEETGEMPAIEQAEQFANEGSAWGRSQFVVASVQSLHERRLTEDRFNNVGLVIVDEAHRASCENVSYCRVLDIMEKKNPKVKFLGATATPDRMDGKKLMFDTYAYKYSLRAAIDDGWLVPLKNQIVVVKELDFSKVKKTKTDLDQKALAEAMEQEGPLQEIAITTHREANGMKTVVFCQSVLQAEQMCAIINRIEPGVAEWICGDEQLCPRPVRRDILRRFEFGDVQIILNCAVLLEGWDCPSVEMISVAKPTRSTPMYMQMLGRGTRPLPGIVDGPATPAERIAAILASAKPSIKILDFVDQSRRHDLCNACDPSVLGGVYQPEEIAEAKKQIEAKTAQGQTADASEELEEARARLEAQREAKRIAEEKRKSLVADVSYKLVDVDVFDAREKGAGRVSVGPTRDPPTEKQAYLLRKHGVDPRSVSKAQARGIIGRIMSGTFKRPAKKVVQPVASGKPAPIDHVNDLFRESSYTR